MSAIGKGTCNTTVNWVGEESAIWGKLSVDHDARGKGDLLKRMALIGLAQIDPVAAYKILKIRVARAELAKAFMCAIAMIALLGFEFSSGKVERARVRTGARTVRIVRNEMGAA